MKFELNFELKQQRNDTMDEISKLLRGFNALIGSTTTTVAGDFCDRSHCFVCLRERERERERDRERVAYWEREKRIVSIQLYFCVCITKNAKVIQ